MKKIAIILGIGFVLLMAGCIQPESDISLNKANGSTDVGMDATVNVTDIDRELRSAVYNKNSDIVSTKYNVSENRYMVYHNNSIYDLKRNKIDNVSTSIIEYEGTSVSNDSSNDTLPSLPEYNIGSLTYDDKKELNESIIDFVNERPVNYSSYSQMYITRYLHSDNTDNSVILDINTTEDTEFILHIQDDSNITKNSSENISTKSYRINVTDVRETSDTGYRYYATEILNGDTEKDTFKKYGNNVLSEYAFNISNSSITETSVFNKALINVSGIDDTDDYKQTNNTSNLTKIYESASSSEGYQGNQTEAVNRIIKEFKKHDPYIGGEMSGIWYVNYSGNTYKADLEWSEPVSSTNTSR